MAIFYTYKMWSSSKNHVSSLKGIKIAKKSEIFRSKVRLAGSESGSGEKLSGSATLKLITNKM